MALIVLVSMLFCHVIDDYKLQGILASMKQKSWWESNAPDRLYRNDYLMALVEHAFSWTCSIHIPVLVYSDILVMLGGGFSPLTEQMYYIGGTNSGNAETYTLDTGTSLI